MCYIISISGESIASEATSMVRDLSSHERSPAFKSQSSDLFSPSCSATSLFQYYPTDAETTKQ